MRVAVTEYSGFHGIFALGATPRDIVDRLNNMLVKVLTVPDVREYYATQNVEVLHIDSGGVFGQGPGRPRQMGQDHKGSGAQDRKQTLPKVYRKQYKNYRQSHVVSRSGKMKVENSDDP